MKLRLGIVGIGDTWETHYAPALRSLGDRFEIRSVYAAVTHRAKSVARQFNARVETGFRALASREDVDAVLVLTANSFGALPLLAACDYGKAIYSTLMVDMGPDQAAAVQQRIERAGIAFTAELPCRLAPATLRLKELIATDLGQPQLLFCHYRQSPATSDALSISSSQSAIVEAIDWCRYIVDRDPCSVMGMAHQSNEDDQQAEYQMMNLCFKADERGSTDVMAQISCGRYIPEQWKEAVSFRPPADMQVACQNGIAFVDLPSTLIWFDKAGRHMESLESERPVSQQLFMQFHRSVTSLVRDISSLQDAYRAYWIAVQARASHEQGRRMDLAS